MSGEIATALAASAKRYGKLSIAHATDINAWKTAQDAHIDIITHAPKDTALQRDQALSLRNANTVVCPTLTMMEALTKPKADFTHEDYTACSQSVTNLYKEHVTILVGTDANVEPKVPAHPEFGEFAAFSLHVFAYVLGNSLLLVPV